MSINSFAAIVSDNDGSAFVTKAEFEAMKKEFAAQVTNYNESIDGKIDGAIAAYLAGLQISKKEIIKSNFESVMSNNSWKGIKNIKEEDVIEYFGKVPKVQWLYSAPAMVASYETAVRLGNLTSINWNSYDSANNNYDTLAQSGLGWHLYQCNAVRDGEGYCIWGKNSKVIKSMNEGSYVSVSDSMHTRYQWSTSRTSLWYEQRGQLEYEHIYFNDDTSLIRQFGSPDAYGTAIKRAWRNYCGCTTDIITIPLGMNNTGNLSDSNYAAWSIVAGLSTGRVTTRLGTLTASLVEGKNIYLISKANPKVILYDDEKKYFRIYPDTELDYSTVLSDHKSAIYGTTDAKWGSNRVEHTVDVIVPVVGPVNVDNAGSTYFDLQDLRVEQYEKLQKDVTKNLTLGDGFPLAYIEKRGSGNFKIKIENNSSSETFDEFEVYLSNKPFTELSSLSDALDRTIKVGGSKVQYIPKDEEATISFNLDSNKTQLYLWWQAKNETFGGMITEASDINWTISD